MFLAVVDQTIVATALPAIAGDLGQVERVSWIVVAYLVAATIIAPVYGRLGDVFGRRRMMLVALVITMIGSVLCAISWSMEMLTVARVVQGLGGGGLMTTSQALIGDTIPPRDRARYQGYLSGVMVTSSTFGPVVGGLLTEAFGWQSVFLVNIPVALLAMTLAIRLPATIGSDTPFRFDFLGVLLFALFIASALALLEQVQALDAAALPLAGLLLVVTIVACVLLFWREKRAPDPLLPIPILREPSVWRSDVLAALHGGMLVSLMTFSPIYYRLIHDLAPAKTGVLMLPLAAGIGISSMVTGRIMSRTGYTAVFPSWGLLIVALLLVVLAVFSPRMSAVEVSALLGFTALFMGTTMGVVQVTVQSAVGRGRLGVGAATVQFSRSLGAALGTAGVATVLFASMTLIDPETAGMLGPILQDPGLLASLPPARQDLIIAEMGDAFRAGFLTIALFSAVAGVVAWTLPMRRI
ncbi:MFS transporter [Faunimonas sp. B44]|uniref:MFS transporter n=1 Tax=Faunimonas sp. B44 TaxID=3461493 RepID=UPI0040447B92